MVRILLFCGFLAFAVVCLAQAGEDSTRLVRVNSIYIKGNKKTRRKIITREITVSPGDSLQLITLSRRVKLSRNNVYNTNLFDKVKITIEETMPGQADLLVQVNERWYFFPAPIFRLVDRNFNDWWANQDKNFRRVNYGVRVTQYNFRGRAERLRIVAQTGFEDRLVFNYKIPYIDKKQQVGITPEILLLNTKNLAYITDDHLRLFLSAERDLLKNRVVSVWTHLRKKIYEIHSFGAGFSHSQVADTIAMLNPRYFGGGATLQRRFELGYSYQYIRMNNVNFPLTGYNIYGEVDKKGLSIFDEVDFWSALLSYSKYWDIGKEYYLASKATGFISGGDQPFYNYDGLGFSNENTVRGYELDLIEGKAYLMSKNSARKLLFKREANLSRFVPMKQFQTLPVAIYGKVFLDAAYVWNYAGYANNRRLTDEAIYGLGAGIDLVTMYDVVFRFEYSINAEGERQFFINFMRDI